MYLIDHGLPKKQFDGVLIIDGLIVRSRILEFSYLIHEMEEGKLPS